jgi:hypothetical protein
VTGGYVDWTHSAWTSDEWYDSPDLTSLVQAFIDRAGYATGNYIGLRGLQISGSDIRRACSYDFSGNLSGPKLVVTYTTGN